MNIDILYLYYAIYLSCIVTIATIWFAKGKTRHLSLTALFSFLLNIVLPPAGWYLCWYWSEKPGFGNGPA